MPPLNERLFYAAARNQWKEVEALVAMGGNLNYHTPGHCGAVCLFAAIQSQNAFVNTIMLVRLGAQVNIVDWDGNFPLLLAVIHNNIDVTRLFLKHAPSTKNLTYPGDSQPIKAAIHRGHSEIAILLLKAGLVVIDASDLLAMCIQKGLVKVAETLLETCPVADFPDEILLSILFTAIHERHLAFAETLLDKFPFLITSSNPMGFCALHMCAQSGSEEAARMLLRRNADVEVKANNGLTPLMMAARQSTKNSFDVAAVLLQHRSATEEGNINVLRAFHMARQCRNHEFVRFILESEVMEIQDRLNFFRVEEMSLQGEPDKK